jgi:ACT domain-containing protein
MKASSVKMGVKAGITRHFNISKKLRLGDKATIFSEGIKLTLKVDEWINRKPEYLYRAVHTGEASLTRDAHYKLKQAISKSHPELLEWTQKSKNKFLLTKKVQKLLRKSK